MHLTYSHSIHVLYYLEKHSFLFLSYSFNLLGNKRSSFLFHFVFLEWAIYFITLHAYLISKCIHFLTRKSKIKFCLIFYSFCFSWVGELFHYLISKSIHFTYQEIKNQVFLKILLFCLITRLPNCQMLI